MRWMGSPPFFRFLDLGYGEYAVYLVYILPELQALIGCFVQYSSTILAFNQTVFCEQLDIWINGSEVEVCLINYSGFACTAIAYVEDLGNDHMSASFHHLPPFIAGISSPYLPILFRSKGIKIYRYIIQML